MLGFVAAQTTTLGLATGVLILPAHNPVTLAKRLSTLDALSKGRVRLGIGVGWMREELEACGTDFETRGRRTDESIEILRTLWADSGDKGAAFSGDFFHFVNAHSFPKPYRSEGIPIHIGGHSKASVKRAARIGDGWQPLGLKGEEFDDAYALLQSEARAAGRNLDGFEVTISTGVTITTLESVEKAAEQGVTRLSVSPSTGDLEKAKDELSELADRVGLVPPNSKVKV